MRPLILFAILIVAVAIILPFTPWVPPNWSNTINTIRRQVSEQVARFNQPVQPVQPPQPVQPVQPPQPPQPVQPVQPTQPPQPPQPPQPVQPTQPQPPQPPQTEEPTESTTTSVPTNESTTESDEDVNEAAVTTSLTSCYTFTKQDNTVVKVTGQNLLKGVNAIALALLASAGNPHPTTWPSSARKCSGSGDNPPTPGNNSPNSNSVYYGDLNSPRAFRQLSQMKCGNLRGGNGEEAKKYSFFALDNFIYYRICEQGNSQTNYIFFWGTVNGVTSSCFGAAYPAMYKAAVAASPGNPIKVDDFTRLISKGTPLNYAFGNLGAAIGVAETARDHNLAVLNFLLADTHTEATRLLAGHCPPSVKKCNNHNDPQNGVHPLAWGGAKVSMMTGSDWGQQNGATSQFGKNFEASVAADWLIAKRSGAVASDCSGALSISETAKALTPLIEAMTGPINN